MTDPLPSLNIKLENSDVGEAFKNKINALVDGLNLNRTEFNNQLAAAVLAESFSQLAKEYRDAAQGTANELAQRVSTDGMLPNGGKSRYYSPAKSITEATDPMAFEVYQANADGDALMSFHIGGVFAANFGIDRATHKWCVGGWSTGEVKYALFHEGNPPTAKQAGAVANAATTIVGGDLSGQAIFAGRGRIANATSGLPPGYPAGSNDFWFDSKSLHGLPANEANAEWVRVTVYDLRSNRMFQRCRFNGVWETEWDELSGRAVDAHYNWDDSTVTLTRKSERTTWMSLRGRHTVRIDLAKYRVGDEIELNNAADDCVLTTVTIINGDMRLPNGTKVTSFPMEGRITVKFRYMQGATLFTTSATG